MDIFILGGLLDCVCLFVCLFVDVVDIFILGLCLFVCLLMDIFILGGLAGIYDFLGSKLLSL